MRSFIGDSKYSPKGINSYCFVKHVNHPSEVMMDGIFTLGELIALVDAIKLENTDNFKFPTELKRSKNKSA